MLMLVAGLALFFAAHSLTMRRDLRAGLVARLGEVPYKIVYSAASLAGLLLIVYGYGGYRAHGWIEVWNPPTFMRHIALALMPFAFIALVAAYAPGRIKQALKHPMLVAIKIWALSHLLANGDLGSILLFGTFLAYAVVDRI